MDSTKCNGTYPYLTAEVNTGATQFALEFLHHFDAKQLIEVRIIPDGGGFQSVQFFYEENCGMIMMIHIYGGFGVGYRGEGPWGLHDYMEEAGFNETMTNSIFTMERNKEYHLVK